MEIPFTTRVFIKKVDSRSQRDSHVNSLDDARFPLSVEVRANPRRGIEANPGVEHAHFYIEAHNGNIVRAFGVGNMEGEFGWRVSLENYGDKGAKLAKRIRDEFSWIVKKIKNDPELYGDVTFKEGETL